MALILNFMDGAALRPALLLFWQQPPPQGAPAFDPAPYAGGASFFLMLVQTLLALGLVCGLAYVIFRWVLPRLSVSRASGSMVRVVDRVGLDARKSLYVVEVAGRWLLVGASESGVSLVSELDAESAAEAADEIERARPNYKSVGGAAGGGNFADRLAQLLNKKR